MTKKQVIIGIIILLVVGVAGFVGYKMYLKKKAKNENEVEEEIEEIIPISTEIESPSIVLPEPQIQPQLNNTSFSTDKFIQINEAVKRKDIKTSKVLHEVVAN